MGCKECGKPKCDGECGCKSPKVLQINNPAEYITFHKVSIPAAMGDSTTNPPKIGAYRNALVYYEADHTSWMYSTDGIPTLVTGEQGPQGPAGTVTVGTTTTGDPGSNASVKNVGTPENAILDFTVPQGPRVPEEEVQHDVNNKLDAMAEDGTLEQLIGNYFNRNVKYVFPKAGANSGDSELIIYSDSNLKKSILIDTNILSNWSMLHDMLIKYDITHLDYFILSHYDYDHYSNLENLINYHYIDNQTTVYMPAQVTNYGEAYTNAIASVNALLTINNIPFTVPTELQKVEIVSGFDVTFANVDKNILENYTNKIPNNASLCCLFNHDGVKALYTGDADIDAQNHLYDIKFPSSSVSLYKVSHHGINQKCNEKYIQTLRPIYAVQCGAIGDFSKNNFGMCEETRVLKETNTRLYPTYLQNDFIEFESCASAINIVSGIPYEVSGRTIDITYYVDNSVSSDTFQDGSQSHPFKEIMQAIAIIPNGKSTNVTINVAEGYYGNSHEIESGKNQIYIDSDATISINGVKGDKTKVKINGFNIYKSRVNLKDITIDVDNRDGIYNNGSYVTLNNVNIKSVTDTQSTNHSGIVLRSGAYIVTSSNVYITQVNEVITGTNSFINVPNNTLTVGSHNAGILNAGTCFKKIGQITFENSEDYKKFKLYFLDVASPISIMNPHDNFSPSVTTSRPFSEFDYVDISYHSVDNEYGSIRVYSPNGKSGRIVADHLGGNSTSPFLYNKTCKFSLSGSTLTLTWSVQETVNINTNGVTYTLESVDNPTYFNIDKIIGHYKDYK